MAANEMTYNEALNYFKNVLTVTTYDWLVAPINENKQYNIQHFKQNVKAAKFAKYYVLAIINKKSDYESMIEALSFVYYDTSNKVYRDRHIKIIDLCFKNQLPYPFCEVNDMNSKLVKIANHHSINFPIPSNKINAFTNILRIERTILNSINFADSVMRCTEKIKHDCPIDLLDQYTFNYAVVYELTLKSLISEDMPRTYSKEADEKAFTLVPENVRIELASCEPCMPQSAINLINTFV